MASWVMMPLDTRKLWASRLDTWCSGPGNRRPRSVTTYPSVASMQTRPCLSSDSRSQVMGTKSEKPSGSNSASPPATPARFAPFLRKGTLLLMPSRTMVRRRATAGATHSARKAVRSMVSLRRVRCCWARATCARKAEGSRKAHGSMTGTDGRADVEVGRLAAAEIQRDRVPDTLYRLSEGGKGLGRRGQRILTSRRRIGRESLLGYVSTVQLTGATIS
eukprot:scaffold748_cov251-Pinguiococcus_pyrenoidosus.AAC.22